MKERGKIMKSVIKDKVIIITGASSGIGEASAKKLAKHGAIVVLGARRLSRIHSLAKEIKEQGGKVFYKSVDVTKKESVQEIIDFTIQHVGKIDAIFNNAGLMPLSPLYDLKMDEWNQMVDTNIKGVLHGIGAVLPVMRKQGFGHIITTDSVAGHVIAPYHAVYSGTKFAVRAIMEGLRQEETTNNIKSTIISPGFVNTELYSTITNKEIKKHTEESEKTIGLDPEDVANAVLFALNQPEKVGINEILLRSIEQV